MSIIELRGGPVTHRYLMNKRKDDLARMYLDLLDKLEYYNERYGQLVFSVAQKFPGESRHETALRYIRERENAQADANDAGETANA